ncbi:MAG: copper chaperone PCu(A)C [Pseudomonadota bacterium]
MRSILCVFALLAHSCVAFADPIRHGALELNGAFAYSTPPTARAAGGYLTIHNTGESADRLIGAEAAFARTEIHTTEVDDKGVARMIHQKDGLEVPAGGTLTLEPGGYHVMFMGLDAPFEEGKAQAVTLIFEEAGPIDVSFDVVPRGGHEGHKSH